MATKIVKMLNDCAGSLDDGPQQNFLKDRVYEMDEILADAFVRLEGAVETTPEQLAAQQAQEIIVGA